VDIEAFVAALPKAELHVHLVGAASVDTVLELSRRHPERRVPTERAELERYYEFRDFPHFITVYSAVNKLVTTPEDVQTLLLGLARDLAANNVRYAEVTVSAIAHFPYGVAPTCCPRRWSRAGTRPSRSTTSNWRGSSTCPCPSRQCGRNDQEIAPGQAAVH